MGDLLAPWGHGDILACGAAKGHVWVLTQPQLWPVLMSMAPATTKVQEDRTAQRVGLAPLLDTIVKLAPPTGNSLEDVSMAELAHDLSDIWWHGPGRDAPFTPLHLMQTRPQGQESRRAGLAPHGLQHLGEPVRPLA